METLTGREAALNILEERGVEVLEMRLQDLHTREAELFRRLREREPVVVVLEADDVPSLDIMALRWLFRGGVTPLVLCPSSAQECAELADVAAKAAALIHAPVFLLIEPDIGAEPLEAQGASEPIVVDWNGPSPIEAAEYTGMDPDAIELLELDRLLRTPLIGFEPVHFESAAPEQGRPEWLLVSYGAGTSAARLAAEQATATGMRLHHAALRQLWPVPDEALLKAAMGTRHVVVAERNLGQYALEVRRILPELAVIPAGGPGRMKPEHILRRLQRSPRCC
jgi:hypothetical protein